MPAAPADPAPLPWVTRTVVFADVVESVRLYAGDEAGQIARLRGLLRLLEAEVVPAHQGTVLERRGDALLAAFEDTREAVAAAHRMHAAAAAAAALPGAPEPLWLRIGMHRSELMFEANAAYGQGLNIAARLMSIAAPGQIVVSEAVRDELAEPLDGELHDLGPCHLRHLPQPVRAFRLQPPPAVQAAVAAARTAAPSGLPRPEPIRTRLAVLPLASADGTEPPAVADVLVDQWITALSTSPVLQVTSFMSSRAFRGRALPPRAAGRHLQVDFVLAGRADAPAPGTLRTALQLIHVETGDTVWQDELVFPEAGVVDVTHPAVAQVAQRVVEALAVTEWRLATGRPLPNLALHTLHLASVNLLHRFGRHDFERAHDMLQALRDRVSRHATPLAWLARWHVFRIVQGWSDSREQDGAQALEYAQRALDIDPGSSLALSMAGSVQAGVRLDMAAARSYYDQALAQNPNEPLAWLLKSVAHGFLGEGAAALAASERSLQLSPLDPLRYYYDSLSAAAAMGAQRYERAVELAERAIRANSLHGSAYRALAIAQAMLDRPDDARQTVQRLLAVEPGSSVRQFMARAAVDSEQNRRFAQALREAGLPPG